MNSNKIEARRRTTAIRNHYEHLWSSASQVIRWDRGPIHQLPKEFAILCFAPTTMRGMWTYATCGMSSKADLNPIELHLFAPTQNKELVELLTVVAHYHRTGAFLGLGDTVNFGRPWLSSSLCEYGLISLPYLDGSNLEWLDFERERIRFLWLIPVTYSEVQYKKINGLSALEDKLESSEFNYVDPMRQSVV